MHIVKIEKEMLLQKTIQFKPWLGAGVGGLAGPCGSQTKSRPQQKEANPTWAQLGSPLQTGGSAPAGTSWRLSFRYGKVRGRVDNISRWSEKEI